MNDVRGVIAANLSQLRKQRGLTQAGLAEMLGYSDKAISRWERGDTMPDISVLVELCRFYGVTLDDLIHPGCGAPAPQDTAQVGGRITVCSLMIAVVWLVATVLFVYGTTFHTGANWKLFIYAIPVSFFVLWLFNRRWGLPKYNVYIVSALIWTLLLAFYIGFLSYNVWLVFVIGIPAQICVILWHRVRRLSRKDT